MAGGRLVLPISEPILTAAGLPASGSVLTWYDAGTSDLSALFADADLMTPIDNPLTADSAGRFYAQTRVVWADDAIAYDGTVDVSGGGGTLTFPTIYTLGAQANTSGLAPLDSPAFTGTPTAPTPATNDVSQKLATTAFVAAQGFAALNSPAFTGNPTAPTQATGNDSTRLASTAFVQDALLPANLATSFAQSLGTSGYITLPGGLIVQWNTVTPGDDSYTVYTLPHPFTTTNYGVIATVKYNAAKTGGNGGGAFGYPVSTTQVGIGIAWNGDSTGIDTVFYVAFGK
jgi:hypothetical protein